jgi:hypothetical protein
MSTIRRVPFIFVNCVLVCSDQSAFVVGRGGGVGEMQGGYIIMESVLYA